MASSAAAAVYRLLHRSSHVRPYLPAKKYDTVSVDDEPSRPPAHQSRELGADEARQCRICLSTDAEVDLISPCLCAGSVRWVHRGCLDEWRAQEIRPNSFDQCELCQFVYRTERRELPGRARLRLRMLMLRDLSAAFAAVQLVIVVQAALLRALDAHGRVAAKMPLNLGATHPFIAWYCLSLLLVLALVGLVGMCVACTANDAPALLCVYDPWLSASTGDCLFAGCEVGELGALCAGMLIVALLVLAIVGVVCSVFFAAYVFSYVARRHADLSQRRDEARHVVVVDLATADGAPAPPRARDADTSGGGGTRGVASAGCAAVAARAPRDGRADCATVV
ncbi:hypothetical protein KFE25_004091 [Diacronema lutheri]|uniref:RING-CH-type domain-containing protein n=1 Tax=Diacronema lutheri TaxID=2081491 RepID=A0A8J5XC13_DIALT|nr:hypothetical protein KFE25_004091 [Diacronema lutheri]